METFFKPSIKGILKILFDIGYCLILLQYRLEGVFRNYFAEIRFPILFSFVPFCGSEYGGIMICFRDYISIVYFTKILVFPKQELPGIALLIISNW